MYAPSLDERVNGSPQLRRRQAIGRSLARVLGRLDVRGVANVPPTGPVVLAVNHVAVLDGPLLFGLVPRPVSFLVKIEAFTPHAAPVLLGAGQIPLERDRFDPAPIRLCLRILQACGVVGIFPEGSRGDGRVRTAKPGVGYFALRTGAVVVPVACHGTDLMTRRRGLPRPQACITFGPPLRVPAVRGRSVNRREVAVVTEQVRATLAALVAGTASRPPAAAAA